MRIARRFAVVMAALSVCLMANVAKAASFVQSLDPVVANAVVVTYDPTDGNVSYDGNGKEITTFELKSASSMLIPAGVNEGIVTGPFDVLNAGKFFTLTTAPNQVAAVNIGKVMPAGLTADQIIADASIGGSLYPSGGLDKAEGGGPYLYVVPEPTSLALVCCGLLGLLGLRRK